MYSSSPVHGPLLVSTILNDADLKALWEEEVKVMVDRLISMRITLRQTLEELNSSSSWEHITKQVTILKSLHNRILNAAANCQNFRLECFTSLVYPLRKLTTCKGIFIYT
uniref:Aspartate aminotransferase n=1 Tax=Solanum tuberosum TaxID=4113 RepID=M1A8L2_SOLTU